MRDHVHMLLAIPPKYAVAQVMGFLKGRSAIHIARVWGGRKHQYRGSSGWKNVLAIRKPLQAEPSHAYPLTPVLVPAFVEAQDRTVAGHCQVRIA